jgi:predicted PurR-regulated permease PerM
MFLPFFFVAQERSLLINESMECSRRKNSPLFFGNGKRRERRKTAMTISIPQDITRTTLIVLFIGILIGACFWVLRPFVTAFIWATMIVVATWPLFLALQARLWGRRRLAVAVMTVLLLLALIVPLSLAVATIVTSADQITIKAKSLLGFTLPPAPDWLVGVPVIGTKFSEYWERAANIRMEEVSGWIAPYTGKLVGWFAEQAGSVAMMVLEFMLTVIISAILFTKGETVAAGVRSFARRLGGAGSEEATLLAAKAVRSVALGIGLTAIIQSSLGGIGLAVAGVPAASILTGVMLILCIAQIGPSLVLVPSIIFLYWKGAVLWGTVLLIWSIPVVIIDNILRPVLIKRGADLPLLLIFAGVIGGLVAFGIIGLFIGPVVLAVTYTLLKAWVVAGEQGQETVSRAGK